MNYKEYVSYISYAKYVLLCILVVTPVQKGTSLRAKYRPSNIVRFYLGEIAMRVWTEFY